MILGLHVDVKLVRKQEKYRQFLGGVKRKLQNMSFFFCYEASKKCARNSVQMAAARVLANAENMCRASAVFCYLFAAKMCKVWNKMAVLAVALLRVFASRSNTSNCASCGIEADRRLSPPNNCDTFLVFSPISRLYVNTNSSCFAPDASANGRPAVRADFRREELIARRVSIGLQLDASLRMV